jgi:serine/threonine protein kinase
VLENASDMATTLIGTPYYMSPELFSNKPYSYKVYIVISYIIPVIVFVVLQAVVSCKSN